MKLHVRHQEQSAAKRPLVAQRVTRADAEALYAKGCDAVVEALIDMDRRIRALMDCAGGTDGLHAQQFDVSELPPERASVALIPRSGRQVPARVRSKQGSTLVVVAVVEVPAFSASELKGMVIEHSVDDGRVRLGGHFSCPDASSPEVLRIDDCSVLEVIQERDFLRADIVRPAHVIIEGSDGGPQPTETANISAGGVLLDGPRTLEIGTRVSLELGLMPGRSPLRASGRVARHDQNGRPGVVFDTIDALDRRCLASFVSEMRLQEGFGRG